MQPRCNWLNTAIGTLGVVTLALGVGPSSPAMARGAQGAGDADHGRQMERPRATTASEFADDFVVTARKAYLVGGEGRTDNSVRYDGSKIWYGPGHATVLVDEVSNSGVVIGTIRSQGHTYTILMHEFSGTAPFMSGGIARNLFLHGLTGQGPPLFPRVLSYLAGWGKATVFKDDRVMYEDFGAHFMLTQGVRDKDTHGVQFPSAEEVQTLLTKSADTETLKSIKHRVEDSAQRVNPTTMQLHIVAHSHRKDPQSVPPFTKFIHFMFDEVTWH